MADFFTEPIHVDIDGIDYVDYDGGKTGMNECFCKVCDAWFDTRLVEFINVEENAYGEDSFTFKCHVCGSNETSLVRYIPGREN